MGGLIKLRFISVGGGVSFLENLYFEKAHPDPVIVIIHMTTANSNLTDYLNL